MGEDECHRFRLVFFGFSQPSSNYYTAREHVVVLAIALRRVIPPI